MSEDAAAPDVSVLIVAYQARDMTLDCLEDVFTHTADVSYEVLLIDNGDDGTEASVARRFPQVRIVPSRGNIGFAGGNNEAARHARGTHLLLLNPDTRLHDNAIGALYRCARRHPDCGAWGGMTFLPGGRRDASSTQIGPSLLTSLFNAIGLGRRRLGGIPDHADAPAHVKVLSGAFLMIPRAVWEQLGGFDESFFLYNEEVDLCLRIRRDLNRPLMMTPDARITHLVGTGKAMSPKRIMAMMQSRMHLDRKHHGPMHNLAKGGLTWLHAATRTVAAVVAKPLIGSERAASLRDAFAPIARHPGRWWYGFRHDDERNASTHKPRSVPHLDSASSEA